MVVAFGDNLRRTKVAYATYLIACAFVAVFIFAQQDTKIFRAFGFIPLEFSLHPLIHFYTLISAQFLHVDLLHLTGNTIFLLAFGRSLENLLKPLLFVSSFTGLGALAFLGSWLLNPTSPQPIVGASGALSFLLGGYTILFPQSRLKIIPAVRFLALRAWIFALIWFVIQLYGLISEGERYSLVAYGTHIAGFVLGIICALAWKELALDTDRQLSELNEEIRKE